MIPRKYAGLLPPELKNLTRRNRGGGGERKRKLPREISALNAEDAQL